jgi:hypothetical protein
MQAVRLTKQMRRSPLNPQPKRQIAENRGWRSRPRFSCENAGVLLSARRRCTGLEES